LAPLRCASRPVASLSTRRWRETPGRAISLTEPSDTGAMVRLAAATLFVVLGWAGNAHASCDLGMLRMYTLASGHLAGATWSLRAIDSGDGRYAFEVIVGRSRRAHHSGRFYVEGPGGAPVE